MATKKAAAVMEDGLTVGVPIEEKKNGMPTVNVFIPKAQEAEAGILVDPYEHVTVGNLYETKEYKVLRGVHVDVPVNVFEQLRNKYPNL